MDVLRELEDVIRDRKANPRPGSYTSQLFEAGLHEIAKKVGEEAIEVIVAAVDQDEERLAAEAADVMYHLLVLLAARNLSWDVVEAELVRRRK